MSRASTSSATPYLTVKDRIAFQSILFDRSQIDLKSDTPEFFRDLNLSQVIASITSGREEYNLAPFFHTLLFDLDIINFRQEVFRDLENRQALASIQSLAQKMQRVRSHLALAEKLHYKYEKEAWYLEGVSVYCRALAELSHELNVIRLHSKGLLDFREYLNAYVESNKYTTLSAETRQLTDDLLSVRYCLHIDGNRVAVTAYDSESDYAADVLQTFENFRQGESRQYQFRFSSTVEMNHVEAAILDLVTKMYPGVFSSLDKYCDQHRGFLDDIVVRFDREIQFYVAVIEHSDRLKKSGLHFCLPIVTALSKEVCGRDVFDLALADKLTVEKKPVVVNDFHLTGAERIFVITGPNQGGKTTFARTFGQLHYLAMVGCPVPGSGGNLFLFDQLFTHFEREEDIHNLRGKLEDDLLRMREIVEAATSDSILIMNESFLSTTLNDAMFLSTEIMQRIVERDMLCVAVTFIDELASVSEKTVSMVSRVDPNDPAIRTFKVVRRPADGLAYAAALAEKHGLRHEDIKRRIATNGKGVNLP